MFFCFVFNLSALDHIKKNDIHATIISLLLYILFSLAHLMPLGIDHIAQKESSGLCLHLRMIMIMLIIIGANTVPCLTRARAFYTVY